MPIGRRSHTKSRTGCMSCKKRRIKCDEGKPACTQCLQHRIQCDYKNPSVPSTRLPTAHTISSAVLSPNGLTATSTPICATGAFSSFQSPLQDIDTTDFRLLHNFTTSTYLTLSDQKELRDLWQQQIPDLAFSHSFLLRVIFAMSALHLYRKTSDTNYLAYALQKYEEALKSSSLVLTAISPVNCHALYACAALGFLFEFGAPSEDQNILYNANGALAPWVIHVRGVRIIIASSWHDLESGVLGRLFEHKFVDQSVDNIEACLGRFAEHIQSTEIDTETLSTYLEAVQDLTKWSKMVEAGFFAWMCQTSDDFATLLAEKQPFALVIFGYSCVLLKYGEPRYWIEGRAKRLLREIYGYLHPHLRVWLEWPLAIVG
ncbi:unnamed protein product [Penicillium salamii]|uniref:Zn(2)-C6 fungal-type domain-containing protein n=1 Tax=Penicillium salamii TaxID=1612424 RepID=A0A9W4IU97_9EURO|nr:unnamed protein product [Penicillium salamii]